MPGGQPPVMTHDVAGNAVVDPRELEKNVDLAEESRKSNDAKDEQGISEDGQARFTTEQESGRGRGASGSARTTAQPQVKGKGRK